MFLRGVYLEGGGGVGGGLVGVVAILLNHKILLHYNYFKGIHLNHFLLDRCLNKCLSFNDI